MNSINYNSRFKYSANINANSKGGFIFNLANNKIIGIHNKSNPIFNNEGLFFNSIIKGFSVIYKHNIYLNNEINIVIKVEKKDINKKVYFLDNFGQIIMNMYIMII